MKRLILILLLFPLIAQAQVVYNMSNATVTDCEGILQDSGEGTLPGHYDHNENFTFTICVPGASSITMTFSSFCTEADYDSIRFYDGVDTFATQIGPSYDGVDPPPTIVTTDSCLTINFITDANITCDGWVAFWEAEIEEPELPEMTLTDINPPCSTSMLILTFDEFLPCDSILQGNFDVSGPISNNVTNINPLNCTNDSTNTVQIDLSPGLEESGYFEVTYTNTFVDECGNVWTVNTSDTLLVNDCPLEVELVANPPTICEGECTEITAVVSGGDPLSYNFVWNPPLFPNTAGPHTVCPTLSTVYSVTVSDNNGSVPASDDITVNVIPAPMFPTISSDTTVCQSIAPFQLSAAPFGGYWLGNGITDSIGIFDPDTAMGGTHSVTYVDLNGCSDSFDIEVIPIDAGPDEAACPNSGQFFVLDGEPAGGIWSGPFIQPNGLFSPAVQGTYVVTYEANGCTDTKTIYVEDIVITAIDTVCRSDSDWQLSVTPAGGIWSGNGIINSVLGIFRPRNAGAGDHTLTYTINGCNSSFDIYVKDVFAGGNFTACPFQDTFLIEPTPTPAGGYWTGIGIVDSLTGSFDPTTQGGNYNDTLFYIVDGCEAQRICYVRETVIQVDTLWFCPYDTAFQLNWASVRRSPGGGIWYGPGIDTINNDYFVPSFAGSGIHTIFYENNTCTDSMTMIVYDRAILTDTSVCELAGAFQLSSSYVGGGWHGTGITDTTGIFDPQVVGIGIHEIYFRSPFGCWDTTEVEVYQLPVPSIDNLLPSYCYKDTVYQLIGSPAGGTFSGTGIVNNTFNPTVADTGQHLISYVYGSGDCQVSTFSLTNVTPPMDVQVAFEIDTICFGEYITISAQASGGSTAAYNYNWDQGLGNGALHPVNPATSTAYTVTATDGCSDPVTDDLFIFVYPEFSISFNTSDSSCFGLEGYAAVDVNGSGDFAYEWNTNPPQYTDSITAPSYGYYVVTVTETNTGCSVEDGVVIESYEYVRAAFNPNPNNQCVDIFTPYFNFLDLSSGGNQGYWSFGDGDTIPYVFGENPAHTYADTGTYQVSLYIENDAGCWSRDSAEVCVIPEKAGIYIPNAFSPNGDGQNESFGIQGIGIIDYEMQIFNRWGMLLFSSDDPNETWDGSYKGKPQPEGVYVYSIRGIIRTNNTNNNYHPVGLDKRGTITLIR